MVWVFVLSWPLRTNHHARIVMGLVDVVSAEALSDIQFSIVARPDHAIPLRTMTQSAMVDGPRPRSA